MKQFFAFVHKEFYHIIRDSRTMLIILGMPIAQMLLFGFAMNMEVTNIRLAIYDPTPDAVTTQISKRIRENFYFKSGEYVHTISEIEQQMRQDKLDLALIFESDFQKNLLHTGSSAVQLLVNSSDPNRSTLASNYLSAIVASYQQEQMGIAHIPYNILLHTRMLYNPGMKSAYIFVPGIMGLVLMMICAMMTSVSIVREKERGTMEVLLASPLKQTTVIFAKTIPYLLLSLINFITIILISYFILKVPIAGNLLLLTFVSLLYIFLSLMLGLFISTLVKTQVNAVIVSGIFIMVPVLILSGMIFPIENMPNLLKALSYIVPSRWYITAVRKIMIQGQGFLMVWKEIVIIFGMTAGLLIATLLKTKTRLE